MVPNLDTSFLKNWLDHLLKNLPFSTDKPTYKPSYTVKKQPVSSWGVEMKKSSLILFWFLVLAIFPSLSSGKELPKVAVWDLAAMEVKVTYARQLTAILVSELDKLQKYKIYSQENVRTLAGWTEERMKLGCTNTQCLTALGQMDVTKLISGSVGKIGNRYTISLNLFDTQKAEAEKAISEFCRTEDELIELVQLAARKLMGMEEAATKMEEKAKKTKTAPPSFRLPDGINFVEGNYEIAIETRTNGRIFKSKDKVARCVTREDALLRNDIGCKILSMRRTRNTLTRELKCETQGKIMEAVEEYVFGGDYFTISVVPKTGPSAQIKISAQRAGPCTDTIEKGMGDIIIPPN
ncbi:MAG: hypothetical protein NTX30_05995 [Deltaproteobacteria bacterium]|nr:hypothetical protein [Deltaproteobacteria bacterium]